MVIPEQDPKAAHLVVLAPDAYRGRRIPLVKDELVVGREPRCDVRFDAPDLSRAHAVLRRLGGTVYVQDLNSRAGTLVNGTAASAARPLCPGDIVALADVKLRFESNGAAPTRTKAHWLIWIGVLCFVAGIAGIVGFSAGLVGPALAVIGALLALVGFLPDAVATSRRDPR